MLPRRSRLFAALLTGALSSDSSQAQRVSPSFPTSAAAAPAGRYSPPGNPGRCTKVFQLAGLLVGLVVADRVREHNEGSTAAYATPVIPLLYLAGGLLGFQAGSLSASFACSPASRVQSPWFGACRSLRGAQCAGAAPAIVIDRTADDVWAG